MSKDQQSFAAWLERFKEWLNPLFIPTSNAGSVLLRELQEAWKEWGYAKQYFNMVTEPDLVDLAIYSMSVAEKKYIYLLKKARENGLQIERFGYR
jgi:hypothetical protein